MRQRMQDVRAVLRSVGYVNEQPDRLSYTTLKEMEARLPTNICCFCREAFRGWGNNPSPVLEVEDAVACGDCNAAIVLPQRFRNAARARYDERIQNERELAELIGGEDSDDEMAQNERKVRELVGGA